MGPPDLSDRDRRPERRARDRRRRAGRRSPSIRASSTRIWAAAEARECREPVACLRCGLDATYGELRALVGVGPGRRRRDRGARRAERRRQDHAPPRHRRPDPAARGPESCGRASISSGSPAHRVVERGVAMVPEGRRLFGRMTVEENLCWAPSARGRARSARHAGRASTEIFPAPGGAPPPAGGHAVRRRQQMVAIGRALMARPRLLCSTSRRSGSRRGWWRASSRLPRGDQRGGVAVLLVEQNVRAALGLAHRAYVLEHGRVVGAGSEAQAPGRPRACGGPTSDRSRGSRERAPA